MEAQESGLAFINVDENNPFKLFEKWRNELVELQIPFFQLNTMCLATATKEGRVGNRSVVLKEADENGFVFVTTREGRKAKEIEQHPFVAATFMWNYQSNGSDILKQVRMEGGIHELGRQKCREIYDKEEFYCKIRTHLCHQDAEVDWMMLKQQHDTLVQDALNGKNALLMPDYYVGYRIVPECMDFYYGFDNYIADRVIFTKHNEEWKWTHVAA